LPIAAVEVVPGEHRAIAAPLAPPKHPAKNGSVRQGSGARSATWTAGSASSSMLAKSGASSAGGRIPAAPMFRRPAGRGLIRSLRGGRGRSAHCATCVRSPGGRQRPTILAVEISRGVVRRQRTSTQFSLGTSFSHCDSIEGGGARQGRDNHRSDGYVS